MGDVDIFLYKCKCFIYVFEIVIKLLNQNNIFFLFFYMVDEELFCYIFSFYYIIKWVLSSI